jgi:hypothetical protein
VHKCMSTHIIEGATELGRDGPGPVGPSQPARPTSEDSSAPLFLNPKILQPYVRGGSTIPKTESHSHQESIHKLEREEGDHSGEVSLNSKEEPTSGEEGRHRRKRHPNQQCHV